MTDMRKLGKVACRTTVVDPYSGMTFGTAHFGAVNGFARRGQAFWTGKPFGGKKKGDTNTICYYLG